MQRPISRTKSARMKLTIREHIVTLFDMAGNVEGTRFDVSSTSFPGP